MSKQIDSDELRKELETIIELAEFGIANEKRNPSSLGAEYWKGQRFAATQVLQWLEERVKT